MRDPPDCSDFAMATSNIAPRKHPSENMRRYLELQLAQLSTISEVKFGEKIRAVEKDADIHRIDTPQEDARQTSAAPSVPNISASAKSAPSILLSPFQHVPLAPVTSIGIVGLCFGSALEAQVHLTQPYWRPSPGSYGGPHTDREQAPYVVKLFNSLQDTSAVYDKKHYAANFQPGGLWTQDPTDIEAICWKLVQETIGLHVVGAVGLKLRRAPQILPRSDSIDASLTFGQRIFCLELLTKHYKAFAHQMMLQQDVEESLIHVHRYLIGKYQYGSILAAMIPEQQAAIRTEFQHWGRASQQQSARCSSGTTAHDQSRRKHMRSLSGTSDLAARLSPKRVNLMSEARLVAPNPTPCDLPYAPRMSSNSIHQKQPTEVTSVRSSSQVPLAYDTATIPLDSEPGEASVKDTSTFLNVNLGGITDTGCLAIAAGTNGSTELPETEVDQETSHLQDIEWDDYIHLPGD